MKKFGNFSFIFILAFIVGSCVDQLPDEGNLNYCPGLRVDGESCPTSEENLEWNFSNAADYSFDSSFIDISSGKAGIKGISATFSGDAFSNGNFIGTKLFNNEIVFKSKNDESLKVSEILSDKNSHLKGYWRLDGNWNDESGNSLNASGVNGANFSEVSKLGSHSGEFDGISQFASVSYTSILNPNEFTFSCWARVTSGDGTYRSPLTSRGSGTGFLFYAGTNNYWQLWIGDGSVYQNIDGQKIVNGEWAHLTGTYDGTTLKFYINGVQVNTLNTSYVPNTTHPLYIGSANSNFRFPGQVDEVAIWSTALSSTEVQKLYSEQSQLFSDDTHLSSVWTPHWNELVGYWKMDGNWEDSSNNSNKLTVNGDGVTFGEPKIGISSGEFAGSSDYLTLANDNSDYSQGFTIGAWTYIEKESDWQEIFWKGDSTNMDFQLIYQSNNRFFCRYFNNGNSVHVSEPSNNFHKDKWRHVLCVLDPIAQTLAIYIDGKIINSKATGGLLPPNVSDRIKFASSDYIGHLDDMVIWKTALSAAEISEIYHRQKQKYAASYISPVTDFSQAEEVKSISAKTNLPYLKELTSISESQTDYSDITADFSNGLIAYWPLNEKNYNSVSGADFEDTSLNDHHLIETGSPKIFTEGVLGSSVLFDGVDDYLSVSDHNDLDLNSNVTLSIWMKSNGELADSSVYGGLIGKHTFGGTVSYAIRVFNSSYEFLVRQVDGTYIRSRKNFTPKIVDGEWKHIVGVANGTDGTLKVYINGVLQTDSINTNYDGTLGQSSYDFILGMDYGGNSFNGHLDEASLFNRALSDSEIKELYQRGANRVKYQVRTCSDSTCSNNPEWKGPGGDGTTTFSELFNRASANILSSFNSCGSNDDNLCSNHEFYLQGTSKSEAFELEFVNTLVNSYNALNSRYYQYRVLFEADDNIACNSSICTPSLNEIKLGTTNQYYASSPSIKTLRPLNISGNITSISEVVSGGCSVKYQFSTDGSNFYYNSSGSWVSANDTQLEANSLSEINSLIKNFTSSGSLYFRAYLISDGSQSCELDKVFISY